jgi:transposase
MTVNQRFSLQFKEDVVDYVLKHPDETKEQIAENFGIGYSTLYRWLLDAKGEDGKVKSEELSVKAENKRLKKENELLKMKNEILIRAQAILAEELSGGKEKHFSVTAYKRATGTFI